uniref:Calcineurin-like phosphoesterase domain-containing protein n=1 Tax=Tetraselmis chuii TaxID=63592 RepID=A0A7S1T4N1_9CHLO|mmetsp:Transcript_491/g.835  ORF Transcript_491/g.835 Transcript_491/m.835 type:complete len:1387 (+) Transcript_491:259-4419(+)
MLTNGDRSRPPRQGGVAQQSSTFKRSGRSVAVREGKQNYTHTHAAAYTVILTSLGCLFTDSTQNILDKYHINRKWFYLYGALFCSAYLYVRPYIRHNIGSAGSGRINFYSIYLAWLLSAWVYHLPGFTDLGIDVKADISLILLVFFASLLTLALFHAAYNVAVSLHLINRRLFNSRSSKSDRVNILLVNSMSFAIACSTYYSFCGNNAQPTHSHIENLCLSLRPVNSSEFPAFSEWVFYGESRNATSVEAPSSTVPMISEMSGEKVISPVLMLWLTMMTLFTANCLADHWACCTINASTTSDLPQRTTLHGRARQHSFKKASTSDGNKAFEASEHSTRPSPSSRLNTSVEAARAVACAVGNEIKIAASIVREYGCLFQEKLGIQKTDGGADGRGPLLGDATPDFLPMVAWFSGTSADLLKTFFDLVISVKIFLGRFDMREMQAASSAAEINRPTPNGCDGDGFTFEHLAEREELWIDFCADTGDGGDPTYAVARAMASPKLDVKWADGVEPMQGSKMCPSKSTGAVKLPRASLMLIGGDLAYPNPSDYSYEKRLFKPFEDALPPPRHYHPGRVVVQKPDLPPDHPAFAMCECDSSDDSSDGGLSGCASPTACSYNAHAAQPSQPDPLPAGHQSSSWRSKALRRYEGPQCFAIPGNHDWIDFLETFMRHFTCKGWLGGWMLPQEKSYFALRLPRGYWVFGLDLGLKNDIDIYQYRYFAHLAEHRLGERDSVVLITHQPLWLLGWFHQKREGSNLNQLVHGHLRGRVPVHLAGDLHFYMRHSLSAPSQQTADDEATTNTSATTTSRPRGLASRLRSFVQSPGPRGTSPEAVVAPLYQRADECSLPMSLNRNANGAGVAVAKGVSPNSSFADLSGACSLAGPTAANGWHASGWGDVSEGHPEHLITCGNGGAFLHPTHVFAEASWLINRDSAAESIASMHNKFQGCGAWSRGTSMGSSPRGYSLTVPPGWEGLFPMMPAPVRQLPAPVAAPTAPAAKYSCKSAFPSPAESKALGRGNIHLFRRQNMKFDVVGGLWYFLLVAGGVPCCGSMATVLEATSFRGVVAAFGAVFGETIQRIFLESHVSLCANIGLFLALLGFAKAGGVGVVSGSPGQLDASASSPTYAEKYRIRSGGITTQLAVALVHTAVHVSVAVSLMLGLDLALETCVRHGMLGGEGYHSLFNWYRSFEAQHFPDPNGLRDKLTAFSLHVYPVGLRWMMAVFDIPEAIALGRTAVCTSGWDSLTRLQYLGYYLGVLAYYWVLATPAIAAIFGCYLYIMVCWAHVHFDEGFSSMRLPHYKGFLRMHISSEGELNIWSLAMRRVPLRWAEDPRWKGFLGGGDKRIPSYKAKYPSRWLPADSSRPAAARKRPTPASELEIVDHIVINRASRIV